MKSKSLVTGVILIGIGLLTGLQALNLIPGWILMYILAAGFLGAYFAYKRNLGFLIPGCILTAIAVFSSIEMRFPGFDGLYFLIFLGIAFFAVFLIHTMHLHNAQWGERYWPIFPAVSLLAIGGLVMAVQQGVLNFDLNYLNLITPAVLVIIGAMLLMRSIRKAR